MMKKAQAAMEFLMTYGWAILVVLVVIGALAYFGILNPQTLLPERCELQQGLYCKDHRISATGDSFTLNLENGMGKGMMVMSVKVDDTEVTPAGGCSATFTTESWATKSGRHIANGAAESFTIPCVINDDMAEAGKKKFSLAVIWYADDSDSTFAHTMEGQLLAKIES